MKLRTLTIFEFDAFSKEHPLGTYHQSSSYAMMMYENKFDYELVGMIDDNNNIVAASLILFKRISLFTKYGYAPKGFLIDYNNLELVKEFCRLLKKRYYNKNFAFIKINPEIAIGYLDKKKKEIIYNENKKIQDNLSNLGFRKLKDNKYFELLIPKFNASLDIRNFNINQCDKRTRNKIRKSLNKGFSFEKGKREDLNIIYKFFHKKKNYPLSHYLKYYNSFSKSDSLDIFLVKINFEQALIETRKTYEKEVEINNKLVDKFIKNNTPDNLRKKMDSDQKLNNFNNEIANLNQLLLKSTEEYVAGAIVIKYKNRVNILISGYDTNYKHFNPNYYLHYKIIEYYKDNYDYLDMNGITGDLTDTNPYKGLNDFKLGFNPNAFELIGELDYIINEGVYVNIDINGFLQKEFDRSKLNKSAPPPKKEEFIKPEKEITKKRSFITISR